MLQLDGSHGEGGGQILRTALAFSALLQRPVTVSRIRANRPKPGLRPQHLQAVRALAAITAAEVKGDYENSTHLTFVPRCLKGGTFRFEIGTAGSCTLLMAAILPPLLFAPTPSHVEVVGGTHVPFSPPYHYWAKIFVPVLSRMGGRVGCQLNRWGWYPEGGGLIRMEILPCRSLNGIRLERRGRLRDLGFTIGLANLPLHIAQREESALYSRLADHDYRARSEIVQAPAVGQGNAVFIKAEFEASVAGFSALGRRGKPAEQVAEEAACDFLAFLQSRAAVDRYLADQLIPYLALAQGESVLLVQEMSDHLFTNIWVVERFLPVHFETAEGRVRVKGLGFTRGE